MFEFVFWSMVGSFSVVWLVGFAVASWEIMHADTPDDGQGN